MTEPFFNAKDAKYKCCLDLLHVKTGASIICLIAALLHLVFVYDIYCGLDHYKPTWIWILSISFYAFCYIFALFGIIYSKPQLMNMAIVYTRIRVTVFCAFTLLMLGALLPSNSFQRFCRYLVTLMCGGKEMNEITITLGVGIVLLHFAVISVVDFCVYDILNKCRQYYIDKAAYDKLTLPQSKVNLPPPAYEV